MRKLKAPGSGERRLSPYAPTCLSCSLSAPVCHNKLVAGYRIEFAQRILRYLVIRPGWAAILGSPQPPAAQPQKPKFEQQTSSNPKRAYLIISSLPSSACRFPALHETVR